MCPSCTWQRETCSLGSCHQGQDELFFGLDFSKGQVLLLRDHGVVVEGTVSYLLLEGALAQDKSDLSSQRVSFIHGT